MCSRRSTAGRSRGARCVWGGIGPERLIVARAINDGGIEFGTQGDQFEPELWETFIYLLVDRTSTAADYAIESWETEFGLGQRVATLHENRWHTGTVERVYSDRPVFAGEPRSEPELYGVRWDTWPRIGNGPDRTEHYAEGFRATDLAAADT